MAFNQDGFSYFDFKNKSDTITHEITHTLGRTGGSRGLNEATTEYLSMLIEGLDKSNSGYAFNAYILREIDITLRDIGYGDLLIQDYYGNDVAKMTIDRIAGEGFYDKMSELMDIADGYGTTINPIKIKKAKMELANMIEVFKKRCAEKNNLRS